MTKKEEWVLSYNKVKDYWKSHQTSSVPKEHELYEWCEIQRNDSKLAKYKKDLLDQINFVWDVELLPIHESYINSIHAQYKKKGYFKLTKNNDMSNFVRLWIYQKEKGMLPKNLQHAFDSRGIELSA